MTVTVPVTFTRPRVAKYPAELGITTKVDLPLFGLFCRVSVSCSSRRVIGVAS